MCYFSCTFSHTIAEICFGKFFDFYHRATVPGALNALFPDLERQMESSSIFQRYHAQQSPMHIQRIAYIRVLCLWRLYEIFCTRPGDNHYQIAYMLGIFIDQHLKLARSNILTLADVYLQQADPHDIPVTQSGTWCTETIPVDYLRETVDYIWQLLSELIPNQYAGRLIPEQLKPTPTSKLLKSYDMRTLKLGCPRYITPRNIFESCTTIESELAGKTFTQVPYLYHICICHVLGNYRRTISLLPPDFRAVFYGYGTFSYTDVFHTITRQLKHSSMHYIIGEFVIDVIEDDTVALQTLETHNMLWTPFRNKVIHLCNYSQRKKYGAILLDVDIPVGPTKIKTINMINTQNIMQILYRKLVGNSKNVTIGIRCSMSHNKKTLRHLSVDSIPFADKCGTYYASGHHLLHPDQFKPCKDTVKCMSSEQGCPNACAVVFYIQQRRVQKDPKPRLLLCRYSQRFRTLYTEARKARVYALDEGILRRMGFSEHGLQSMWKHCMTHAKTLHPSKKSVTNIVAQFLADIGHTFDAVILYIYLHALRENAYLSLIPMNQIGPVEPCYVLFCTQCYSVRTKVYGAQKDKALNDGTVCNVHRRQLFCAACFKETLVKINLARHMMVVKRIKRINGLVVDCITACMRCKSPVIMHHAKCIGVDYYCSDCVKKLHGEHNKEMEAASMPAVCGCTKSRKRRDKDIVFRPVLFRNGKDHYVYRMMCSRHIGYFETQVYDLEDVCTIMKSHQQCLKR